MMKKVYEKPSVEVENFTAKEEIAEGDVNIGDGGSQGVEIWSFRRDMDERAEIPD